MRELRLEKPRLDGSDVREVQETLVKLGYDPKGIDGVYGKKTYRAVRKFQKKRGLKVDGVVGTNTWAVLRSAHQEKNSYNDSPTGRFLNWVAKQVGCLYVWGAQGHEMSTSLIKRMENSLRNYKRAIKQFAEHVKNGLTLVAYDCSGLIIAYLLENGLISHDTTANGLYWNYCVHISKNDLKEGDLVFKKYRTKNKMYHVGVYMGGDVVHAKGRDDGVIRESLSKAGWNRFGRLKCFELETASYARLLKLKDPMLKGVDVEAVQTALKAQGIYAIAISGTYDSYTNMAVRTYQQGMGLVVDGVVGKYTWKALLG